MAVQDRLRIDQGVEQTDAERVEDARRALRSVVLREPERSWTATEFQNSVAENWRSTIRSLAFWRLLEAEEIQIDSETLRVHAGPELKR